MPPDDIHELIGRINADPDKLHGDHTPAAKRLIDLGEPALAPVLPLMLDEHAETRLRAQRVLEGITMKSHGFVAGRGWPTPAAEHNWREFWRALGNLDWQAPRHAREESIGRWTRWLAGRGQGSAAP